MKDHVELILTNVDFYGDPQAKALTPSATNRIRTATRRATVAISSSTTHLRNVEKSKLFLFCLETFRFLYLSFTYKTKEISNAACYIALT